MRGQRLDDGLLIGAGVDRLDLDRRVLLLEAGCEGVDQLGDRPADCDRIEERELSALRLGRAGERHSARNCGGAAEEFTPVHVFLPCWR
ncbi:hypothetical protein D3C87_1926520 [compost metagenome]